jgi:hypothetical protein
MILGPMPFFLIFFAVTMGVNHGENENRQPGNQQNDDDGFIPPDFADKFGQIGIHAKRHHTTFAKKCNILEFGRYRALLRSAASSRSRPFNCWESACFWLNFSRHRNDLPLSKSS